jgi:hypothetical protein
LLIGIPASQSAFNARMGKSDYLARFAKAPEEFLAEVAVPVSQMIDIAREAGATVHLEANLACVAAETRRSDVVILFGHWKDGMIQKSDIDASTNGNAPGASPAILEPLLEKLRAQPQCTLSRALLKTFPVPPPRDAAGIAAWINCTLLAKVIEGEFDEFGMVASPETLVCRRRERLDLVLGDLMRKGNRVELADGLHSMAAFNDAISGTFAGILDLTTCTSICLASFIERTRGASKRFQLVLGDKVMQPRYAAFLIREAIALTSAGMDYMEARDRVRASMTSMVEETEPRPGWGARIWRKLWNR